MKEIKLTNSEKTVLVDTEDYEFLSSFKWILGGVGYAFRQEDLKSMHRLITEAPKGIQVDHINQNKLDNRRSNLRFATALQNQMHKRAGKNNKSGYKGVSLHTLSGKWESRIRVQNKKAHLGLFSSKEEAAIAYNKAARLYFGDFAVLNVVIP